MAIHDLDEKRNTFLGGDPPNLAILVLCLVFVFGAAVGRMISFLGIAALRASKSLRSPSSRLSVTPIFLRKGFGGGLIGSGFNFFGFSLLGSPIVSDLARVTIDGLLIFLLGAADSSSSDIGVNSESETSKISLIVCSNGIDRALGLEFVTLEERLLIGDSAWLTSGTISCTEDEDCICNEVEGIIDALVTSGAVVCGLVPVLEPTVPFRDNGCKRETNLILGPLSATESEDFGRAPRSSSFEIPLGDISLVTIKSGVGDLGDDSSILITDFGEEAFTPISNFLEASSKH
jgi:hypothetical protein